MRKRVKFKRETIPDIGTSRQEGPVLFCEAWYHVVTPGDRESQSMTRSGQRAPTGIHEIFLKHYLPIDKPLRVI